MYIYIYIVFVFIFFHFPVFFCWGGGGGGGGGGGSGEAFNFFRLPSITPEMKYLLQVGGAVNPAKALRAPLELQLAGGVAGGKRCSGGLFMLRSW